MSQPLQSPALRVEDLYSMPDDAFKYELQCGLLVSEPLPGFRHGRTTMRLGALIDGHVRRHDLGVTLTCDTGFILARSPDTVRGPDIAFLRRGRFEDLGDPTRAFPGAPDLAVEVLSPSNTPAEIHAKVADYLTAGTSLVWILDPEGRSVTVHRSLLAPLTLPAGDTLSGEDVLPGFEVAVAEIFEG